MAEISEKSFPFDSELINGKEDRLYLADDFAAYFRSFISSGIFMKEASNLQVIANGDMTVTLKPGKMIIEGYGYENTNDIVIQLDPADGVLDRIDRISATWSQGDRDIHYTLQSSEYSYDPLEPECRRTAEYKDYVVADIRVSAGAISISQENITDQRLNSEVCGLAIPFAEIDTSEINAKLQAYYERAILENDKWREDERAELMSWFDDVKGKLAEDIAVNLQLQIDEITQNHQLKTYLSPKLMDSSKNWSNFKLNDLKVGRKLVATLASAEDISNAYANGVIPVAVAGTLTGINANNTGYYQYVTITGETYINSSESILGNVFTGWKQMMDILTTKEEMQANTLPGKVVDALVIKDIDSSLQWFIDNGYLPDPNNPNIELIPTMTSNTNPSGTVSAFSETQPAYYAFDGNESTYWYTYENTGSYIQYKFDKAKCVRKILVQTYVNGSNGLIKKFKVQASNDGSTFIDLTDTIINSNQSDKGESEYTINNSEKYLYYRVYTVESGAYSGWRSIQMYGN